MQPQPFNDTPLPFNNPPDATPSADTEPVPQPQPIPRPQPSPAQQAEKSVQLAKDAGLEPTYEALLHKASKQLGLPSELLRSLPPEILTQKRHDWQKIAEESPVLTNFIGEDPSQAILALQEVESLQNVEKAANSDRLRRVRSMMNLQDAESNRQRVQAEVAEERERLTGARAGIGHTVSEAWDYGTESQVGLGHAYFNKFFNNDASGDQYIEHIETKYAGRGEPSGFMNYMLGSAAEMLPLLTDSAEEGARNAVGFGGAAFVLGQLGPQVAIPEEVVTVPTAMAAGMRYGMMGNIFEIEAGHAAAEIDKITSLEGEKIDPLIRNGLALAVGGLNTYLEKVGFSSIAGVFKPAGNAIQNKLMQSALKRAAKDKSTSAALAEVAKRYGTAVSTEAGTEMVQEASNILGAYVATHLQEIMSGDEFSEEDKTIFTGENLGRIFEAGKKAAAATATLGFGGTVVDATLVTNDVRNAREHIESLRVINEEVNNTELNKESPELMRKLLQASNVTGNESMDGEAAKELVDQGHGELFKRLGFTEDEITKASDLGENIEIDKATLAQLDIKDFSLLAPVLKANPQAIELRLADSMNPAEEAAILAEKMNEGAEDIVLFNKRLKDIRKQITDAGRSPEEAEHASKVIEKFGLRMAMRSKDLAGTLESIATNFANAITVRRATELEETEALGELIAIDMSTVFRMRNADADSILGFDSRGYAQEVENGEIQLVRGRGLGKIGELGAYEYAVVPRGTDKAVTDKLSGAGVKVLEYTKGDRAEQATKLREEAHKDGLIQTKHKIQGQLITDGEYIVKLFNGSNESTLLHETGHIFLEEIEATVVGGNADQSLIKDFDTLREWLGVEEGERVTMEQHEQFARSFEQWLMEGKAPSADLATAFDRFRVWLSKVYREARSLETQAGFKIKLNDDVRSVFDRMLATEDEIAEMASANELTNLSQQEIDTLVGLSDKDRSDMRDLREKGIQDAARKVSEKRRQGIRAKAKVWRKEARAEVEQEPSNVASSQIKEDGGLNLVHVRNKFGNKVVKELRKRGLIAARKLKDADFDPEIIERDAELADITESKEKSRSGIPLLAGEQSSVINAIDDQGGVKRPEVFTPEYDDIPDALTTRGRTRYKRILSLDEGLPIDVMAQTLGEQGIGDGSVNTLWKLVGKDIEDRQRNKARVQELKDGQYDDTVGVVPDDYSLSNGYANANEMVQDIISKGTLTEQVRTKVNERISNEESLVLGERAILESDEFAQHMEKMSQGIISTMSKQGLRKGESHRSRKRFQDMAARLARSSAVTEAANTSRYFGQMKSAQRSMRQALVSKNKTIKGKDKFVVALDYSNKARLAFERAKLSMEIRREIENTIKLAKKVRKAKAGDIAEQHHQNALALIERFQLVKGVSKVRENVKRPLKELLEGMVEDTLDISGQVDDYFSTELVSADFKAMRLERFRDLRKLLSMLEHMGRDINKRKIANSKLTIQEGAEAISETIYTNTTKRQPDARNQRTVKWDVRRAISTYFAQHRKVASLVHQMSGFKDGGNMWELLIRPMNEAADAEAVQTAKATQELSDIFDRYSKQEQQDMHKEEAIGSNGFVGSKMEQLMIALNTGNEGNYTKLLAAKEDGTGGTGVTPAQVNDVLNSLSEKDVAFVNDVWTYIDSFWPAISGVQRRVTGVTPDKVEGAERQVANGLLKGGYFPIKYEPRRSTEQRQANERDDAKTTLAGSAVAAATRHGHRKARTDGVVRPLRVDFGVISEHVQQVIHDTTHYEFIRDTNRLLRHPEVSKAMVSTYGDIIYQQFTELVENLAVGEKIETNILGRFFNHARKGSSVMAMGWSVTTAAQQFLGYTLAYVKIGPKWLLKGLGKYSSTTFKKESTTEWVHSLSDFMRERARTMNREINEIRNRVMRPNGKFKSLIDKSVSGLSLGKVELEDIGNSYFYLIAKMQQHVDMPTWIGAYEKAMEQFQGDESKAVALADQAVRDSQGGGQTGDLSRIERGGPFLKTWTMFYSIFNVTYNQAVERTHATDFKSPKSIGLLAVDYLMLTAVPATLGNLIIGSLRGDEPDDMLKDLAAENASYILGMFLGIRELSSAVKGFSGYNGPAGSRAITELSKLIKQASQGEVDKPLLKALNNSAGVLFHYPSGQVQRSVDGIMAILDGKTSSPIAPAFGAPR